MYFMSKNRKELHIMLKIMNFLAINRTTLKRYGMLLLELHFRTKKLPVSFSTMDHQSGIPRFQGLNFVKINPESQILALENGFQIFIRNLKSQTLDMNITFTSRDSRTEPILYSVEKMNKTQSL